MHDNEYYIETLIKELRALPADELIADFELSKKHGLHAPVWLDVALAAMAQGERVSVQETQGEEGWHYCIATRRPR